MPRRPRALALTTLATAILAASCAADDVAPPLLGDLVVDDDEPEGSLRKAGPRGDPTVVATDQGDGLGLALDVPGEGRLVEHVVAPKDAEPAIERWTANAYAYLDTRATNKKKLVLYLTGARGRPEQVTTMLRLIASWGFHVLAPSYANDFDLAARCAADRDPECHGKARREVLEGSDLSPHVDVPRPSSLENRVQKLLERLGAEAPGERWSSYYLEGGAIRWSQIVVAGHSHGAGDAAFVSHVRAVARAVLLSGPADQQAGAPARWLTVTGMTPADRLFGFSHVDDAQGAQHLAAYRALEMGSFGAPITVEGKPAPWMGSHQLQASAAPAAGGTVHATTAASTSSPKRDDGSFRYAGVWKHMFGP